METLVFLIVFGIIVMLIAGRKGRSRFGWFLYGMAIFPVALVHILVARDLMVPIPDEMDPSKVKICPRCAETIKLAALVCKHCGHEMSEEEMKAAREDAPMTPAGWKPDSRKGLL